MSQSTRTRFDRKRGRHKKRASRETREWERAHLAPPAPPWMRESTAIELLELRRSLDLLA